MNVTEVTSKEHQKLPERYISFPDKLELAVERLNQIEEKLFARGLIVVKPHNVFRIKYFSETSNPYFMLAFELKMKGE